MNQDKSQYINYVHDCIYLIPNNVEPSKKASYAHSLKNLGFSARQGYAWYPCTVFKLLVVKIETYKLNLVLANLDELVDEEHSKPDEEDDFLGTDLTLFPFLTHSS